MCFCFCNPTKRFSIDIFKLWNLITADILVILVIWRHEPVVPDHVHLCTCPAAVLVGRRRNTPPQQSVCPHAQPPSKHRWNMLPGCADSFPLSVPFWFGTPRFGPKAVALQGLRWPGIHSFLAERQKQMGVLLEGGEWDWCRHPLGFMPLQHPYNENAS